MKIKEIKKVVLFDYVKKKLVKNFYEEAPLTMEELYQLDTGADISKYKGMVAKNSNKLLTGDKVYFYKVMETVKSPINLKFDDVCKIAEENGLYVKSDRDYIYIYDAKSGTELSAGVVTEPTSYNFWNFTSYGTIAPMSNDERFINVIKQIENF